MNVYIYVNSIALDYLQVVDIKYLGLQARS